MAQPRGLIVTVVGDSIAAGLGLRPEQAFPAQLQQALRDDGLAATVRVDAEVGATTADGVRRLGPAVRPDTRVAVVALGANDLLRGVDPVATRGNLMRIVERLRSHRMAVVLAGVSPPAGLADGYAGAFRAAYVQVARAARVPLYPNLLAGVAFRPDLNQADGLHPNARGARLIAERLAPVVRRAAEGRL
ncbi:MAG TPA: GDSL-type esterase/lipase family protein [Caulobacteraceae bacterium]|nr:GDSL-type esterase/lipase family protein [Caulobacteraceae bacterium]